MNIKTTEELIKIFINSSAPQSVARSLPNIKIYY